MEPIGKNRGWLVPDVSASGFKAGLYLLATPIGNLRDISVRALDMLAAADIVACEDTRVTGKLLKAYGISAALFRYNDHSDSRQRQRLVEAVAAGQVVVLVSDAGMVLISDPGYRLVQDMIEAGLYVSSVPGASAPLVALQLSGLPSDRFAFLGFLPVKAGARRAVLQEWAEVRATLLAFETAPRLLKALADINVVMGRRMIAVTRELTKMYEEVRRGSAAELIEHYEEHGLPKGEIVLVMGPPDAVVYDRAALEGLLMDALRDGAGTKEAAALVAERTGESRKMLYNLALEIHKNAE